MVVNSDWKRYNANTQNKSVGDCVKRALTLAFALDYDEVGKELNRIKNQYHYSAFNETRTFTKFLEARGKHFEKQDKPYLTVEEFCESHPSGTYLLLTNRNDRDGNSHMCVVIDGTLYDSWDSQKDQVHEVCHVSDELVEFNDGGYFPIIDDLLLDIRDYAEKFSAKMPYIQIEITEERHVDRNTCAFSFRYRFDKTVEGMLEYLPDRWYGYRYIVKTNPRFTNEQNYKSLTAKFKQKIYDRLYNIRKDVSDFEKTLTVRTNPRFRGDKKLLVQFPEKIIPYVVRIWKNSGGWYDYEVYSEPMPGDPRGESSDDVRFAGDTLTEIKNQMKAYLKNFERLDLDY